MDASGRVREISKWYRELRCKAAVKGLKRRGFDAVYVTTKEDALDELLKIIPRDASISSGGSVTLSEIGAISALRERGNKIITDPEAQGEERVAQRRLGMTADYFLTSANALVIDGRLVNADGTGNRVASMVFGPKTVVAVVGAQKIVDSLDEAFSRIRNHAAPMNAKRIGYSVPCGATGACSDCDSPERMCCAWLILERRPARTGFFVIMVGEPLGF